MFKIKIDPEKIIRHGNCEKAKVGECYIILSNRFKRVHEETEAEFLKDFTFGKLFSVDHDDDSCTFEVGPSFTFDSDDASWCDYCLYPIEKAPNKIQQTEKLETIKKLREGKDIDNLLILK